MTLSMWMLVSPLVGLVAFEMPPVTIDDVSAEVAADRVTVSVRTSGAVAREAITTKVAKGRLHIYVESGRVRPDRRLFAAGDRIIEALPRADYAKLEIPLPAGAECGGPVSVEESAQGLRASVSCRPRATAAAAAPAAIVAAAAKNVVPAPDSRERAALAAAVAIPAEPAATAPSALAPAPAAAAVAARAPVAAPAGAQAQAQAQAPSAEAPAKPAASLAPVASSRSAPALAEPVAAGRSAGSPLFGPAAVLLALAGAAIYFTRRRTRRPGMIQILESVQLGPRRSLVVARVNGETLILGSSEAGIARLGGLEGGGAPLALTGAAAVATSAGGGVNRADGHEVTGTVDASSFGNARAAAAALAAEPADEGGLLARLFRARAGANQDDGLDKIDLNEFDDLLRDSVADEELRRKLAGGQSGKVS